MKRAQREPSEWPDCIATQESAWGGLIHFVPDDVRVLETPEGVYMGDGDNLRRYEPGVVYRASEAILLAEADMPPGELRAVHLVKSVLGVQVERVMPKPLKLWTQEQVGEAWAGWSDAQRDRYRSWRLRALGLLDVSEGAATSEQRALAASWAAGRVMGRERSSCPRTR